MRVGDSKCMDTVMGENGFSAATQICRGTHGDGAWHMSLDCVLGCDTAALHRRVQAGGRRHQGPPARMLSSDTEPIQVLGKHLF